MRHRRRLTRVLRSGRLRGLSGYRRALRRVRGCRLGGVGRVGWISRGDGLRHGLFGAVIARPQNAVAQERNEHVVPVTERYGYEQ